MNLSIRVRWTDSTNLTIGRIFTPYLIHQSYHSCPMDRFDESFHSCPMDGSDESNDWTNIYTLPKPCESTKTYSPILPFVSDGQIRRIFPFVSGSDESNHLCSMDRTRPVLISFPHDCATKFTNRTDEVDSTVLDNPHTLTTK